VLISIGISLCEDDFRILYKIFEKIFTDFFIAEAWVSTRISPSFSSSRQLWFFRFISFYKLLLTFVSRKLENRQELVLLLVQAVNYNFLWFKNFLKSTAKAKKLTWKVKSQDLNSNSLMERQNFCGSLRINWTIRPNLTFACIIG
jgi:hypothetical protein